MLKYLLYTVHLTVCIVSQRGQVHMCGTIIVCALLHRLSNRNYLYILFCESASNDCLQRTISFRNKQYLSEANYLSDHLTYLERYWQ